MAEQERCALGTPPLMRDPVWVYDNWSAYTDGFYQEFFGLPDETRLSEELALRQLRALARLQKHGVHFDAYMMNAFWFDPDGAYRKWRQPDWPDGPDRWIAGCHEQDLKPGLWFGSNSLWKLNAPPRWRDSLAVKKVYPKSEGMTLDKLSFYEGGFFPDFMSVLQHWYDRGIRLFEFDVANFDSATPQASQSDTPEEIRTKNQTVFSNALKDFRRRNPDAMLLGFNDFGGDIYSTATPYPFRKPVDLRWLEVFDSLYTGDIRVSDVPQMNFWRSVDLFNDHMVRRFEQAGVPLERADPFFTLSSTWFGYNRKKNAWRAMLLACMARGSWKKTVYGDLDLLDEDDVHWFAKVQEMYAPLTALGRAKSFGGIPGEIEPYGFASMSTEGAIYTIVNPTQEVRAIDAPRLSRAQQLAAPGRVLFRDAGFVPVLEGTSITLGPEQMCVVGYGRYAQGDCDLGIESDIRIPRSIEPVSAAFASVGGNSIRATLAVPAKGDLRVVFQQRAADGEAPRTSHMRITAEQNGKAVLVSQPDQERAVPTGISWGVGEIRRDTLAAGLPITITCTSSIDHAVNLDAQVYTVEYSPL